MSVIARVLRLSRWESLSQAHVTESFDSLLDPLTVGVALGLDFHVDTSRKIQLHQRIYRLLCRLEDIQKPLMSPNFELFAGLFIYMRRTQNAILIDHSRKRNRATNSSAGSLRGVHDFPDGLIENAMIESFQFNANLMFHYSLFHINRPHQLNAEEFPRPRCENRTSNLPQNV